MLGRNWGQEVVWCEIGSDHHRKSENHQRQNKSHVRQTEEVCGCEEKTSRVWCVRLGIPEGIPVEEHVAIRIEREVGFALYWTFQSLATNWANNL